MKEIVEVLDTYIHYLSLILLSDDPKERERLRENICVRVVDPICDKRFETECPSREELEAEAQELVLMTPDGEEGPRFMWVDDGSCETAFSRCPLVTAGICGGLDLNDALSSSSLRRDLSDTMKGVVKAYIVECVLLREKTLMEMEKE